MKKYMFFLSLISFFLNCTNTAGQEDICTHPNLDKLSMGIENSSYYYFKSKTKNNDLVIVFHDWFGISDLSFEMFEMLNKENFDVILIDLYKGKCAKTNAVAANLMNSIDQSTVWKYLEKVIKTETIDYNNVFLWGFSLGTMPASTIAINNNEIIDGLILFYGNVTADKEKQKNINMPSLMVMGAKDNPQGAIDYFKSVNALSGNASLFIYPNARHAFAQKLFNDGNNYDDNAKNISMNLALTFLKDILNK